MATGTLVKPRRATRAPEGNGTVTAMAAPGGRVADVPATRGLTVSAALKAGGVTVRKGQKLQKNGRTVKPSAKVRAGDTVAAVGRLRGGC